MKMAVFGVKSHVCTHFFGGTCTRYRDKKVVLVCCITNIPEEVVHLRGNHLRNKCFLLCDATDKGKY